MKILTPVFSLLIFLTVNGCCSLPKTESKKELYSIVKETTVEKSMFGKNQIVSFKDFRGYEAFNKNIDSLKARIEGYIQNHPDLSESTKKDLRDYKVARGSSMDEVRLLLGAPDKVIKSKAHPQKPDEVWIYITDKDSNFQIVFLPVYFGHEKYYLYFTGNLLANIERHYLQQTFSTNDAGLSRSLSSSR